MYSELTVTCLEDDRFLILTGGGSELHDLRRLEDIARAEKLSVKLDNVTERLGTLTVAGPRSRDLMARLTDQVSRCYQHKSQNILIRIWMTGSSWTRGGVRSGG